MRGGLEPCRCSRPARDAAPTIATTPALTSMCWPCKELTGADLDVLALVDQLARPTLLRIQTEALDSPDFCSDRLAADAGPGRRRSQLSIFWSPRGHGQSGTRPWGNDACSSSRRRARCAGPGSWARSARNRRARTGREAVEMAGGGGGSPWVPCQLARPRPSPPRPVSASRPRPRPERHPNFNSLLYYIGV